MTAMRLISDHLVQSTVCALVIALATLAFRRDGAAVRHAMWLAASLKFLIPFAVLAALGRTLGVRTITSPGPIRREIALAFSAPQAFSLPPLTVVDTSSPAASTGAMNVALWTAAAVWAAGGLLIVMTWIVRWRRVAAVARASQPVDRPIAQTTSIALRSSDTAIEPGVFGIWRPVLILPRSIVDHFTDDHMATILAHELAHVRRRDNLAAAVHMVVEALFWFHPLVWWLGARQIEERERACDEAVVRSGSEPKLYAETILHACRIYV